MSWRSWPEHPVSNRDYQATTGRQADGFPRQLEMLMDKKLNFRLESWVRQKEHYFLSIETSFYRWENRKVDCGVLEKDFFLYLLWLSGMFLDLSRHFDPRENRLEDKQRCPGWTLRWVTWSVPAFERHSMRVQEEWGDGWAPGTYTPAKATEVLLHLFEACAFFWNLSTREEEDTLSLALP